MEPRKEDEMTYEHHDTVEEAIFQASLALTPYEELAQILDNLPLLVREARRRKRHSLRAAAADMGVPFATLHRLERDRALPIMRHAATLLRYIAQ